MCLGNLEIAPVSPPQGGPAEYSHVNVLFAYTGDTLPRGGGGGSRGTDAQ